MQKKIKLVWLIMPQMQGVSCYYICMVTYRGYKGELFFFMYRRKMETTPYARGRNHISHSL
jgi:hypothetical protein